MRDRTDLDAGSSYGRDGMIGESAYGHVDAFAGTSSARGKLAFWVRHCLEAGRGDGEGEGDLATECGGGGVDAGDIDEDAGTETVFGEGGGVFVDGHLVGGTGVVEV